MKLRDKKLIIFLSVIFLFTCAAATLRTAAILNDFVFSTGYFNEKVLINVSALLAILGLVAALLYVCLGKGKTNLAPNFHGASTYIPAGFLALSLAFFTGEIFRSSPFSGEATSAILGVITVLAALASMLYLFSNPFLGSRYSLLRGALAMAPIIFLMCCAARLYFDTQTPINAPNKSTDQIAYIAAMLFFTGEARLSLGREKWRAYVFLGASASVLTAYSSIPAILVYFIKTVGGTAPTISANITESVLIFALFVFITARVTATAFLKTKEEGKLASKIAEDNTVKEDVPQVENDENQISIDDIINEDTKNIKESK